MKVGTDGVLLGAWTNATDPKTILDIGSGTGLISLMMAQRFEQAKIYSIEINEDAALESAFNFNESEWNDRLQVFHKSFSDFQSDLKFDLIISNPPFFSEKTKPNSDKRKLARHDDSLSLNALIIKSEKMLNKNGIIGLVFPFDQFDELKNLIDKIPLYINRICLVKGNRNRPVKRLLIELSKQKKEVKEEELIIEQKRHQYTDEYISLCKDFYLHF
jgi:tRNA1Val (adenine37-N6)-methyltransferase